MALQIFYTGTLITSDGSDTNAYGEPCEPGHGYIEENGWVDPDWSRFEVYDNQDDVKPDAWTSGNGPMIEWIADHIGDRLGSVEDFNGHGTFYAADSDSDIASGKEIHMAAHVRGCPKPVLAAVQYLVEHRQGRR